MRLSTMLLMLSALGCGAGTDDDCNPDLDGDQALLDLWPDADGDGFTTATPEAVCTDGDAPSGYADAPSEEADCDDDAGGVFPGAQEVPDDGIDQDCSGADLVAGDPTEVYIDPEHPECQDVTSGSRDTPNCSIRTGSELSDVGATVYVSRRTLDQTRVILRGGRTYVGGCDHDTWECDSTDPTVIMGTPDDNGANFIAAAVVEPSDGGSETVVRGFSFRGHPDAVLSVGLLALGSVTLDRVDIRGDASLEAEGSSIGLLTAESTVDLRDSTVHGGFGTERCEAVRAVAGANVTLRRVTVTGCEGQATRGNVGLTARGRVLLEDTTIQVGAAGAAVTGIDGADEADIFLTGVTVQVTGSPAVALDLRSAQTRAEVKNSVLLGAEAATAETGAVRIAERATLVATNSLLFGGDSSGGDVWAMRVDGGTGTLLNSIIRAGSTARGTAWGVRADRDSRVALVANDFWSPEASGLVLAESGIVEVGDVDACAWTGCVEAGKNRVEDPQFMAFEEQDFMLAADSPLVDAGIDPAAYGLIVDRDLAGRPAPSDGNGDEVADYDVGPHER